MTEEERLEKLKGVNRASIYTAISIVAFLAAWMSASLLVGGCFNTRAETMAQSPSDSSTLRVFIIMVPSIYIVGWVFTFLGRRYNKMILPIVIGILLSLIIIPAYFFGFSYYRQMLSYM